jgi:hypothetical protein
MPDAHNPPPCIDLQHPDVAAFFGSWMSRAQCLADYAHACSSDCHLFAGDTLRTVLSFQCSILAPRQLPTCAYAYLSIQWPYDMNPYALGSRHTCHRPCLLQPLPTGLAYFSHSPQALPTSASPHRPYLLQPLPTGLAYLSQSPQALPTSASPHRPCLLQLVPTGLAYLSHSPQSLPTSATPHRHCLLQPLPTGIAYFSHSQVFGFSWK